MNNTSDIVAKLLGVGGYHRQGTYVPVEDREAAVALIVGLERELEAAHRVIHLAEQIIEPEERAAG